MNTTIEIGKMVNVKKLKKNRKGQEVSYLLRHKKDFVDKNGYAPVADVLERTFLTQEELDWIVDNNNKKRFSYNEDKTLIRANQGHNKDNKVDLGLEPLKPSQLPYKLYHGTAPENIEIIKKDGLKPMNRQHVHLSIDKKTALDVGGRHTKNPIILEVYAKMVVWNGDKIYFSENGVYLADYIPPKQINFPE